jgi:WD40 repeat protein
VLAVGGPGGRVTLWDLTDPGHPAALAQMAAPGFSSSGTPLPVFSPDGRLVAAAPSNVLAFLEVYVSGDAAPVSVFDAATGTLLRTLDDNGGIVATASFSPDSRTLATSVVDTETVSGRVILWDAATGAARATLPLPYQPFGVQFAAGGRWLVTSEISPAGSGSGATAVVDVWDSATLARVGEQLTVTGDAAFLTVDRPGGYRIVTGTTNPTGTPIIIDLDPNHWEATACRIAGRNLTQAEWAQFLPGRAYQVTCPQGAPRA